MSCLKRIVVFSFSSFAAGAGGESGYPVVVTASLDKAPIKATSGGWAREITTRGLPIATAIAGVRLFINAAGAREMHWHDSAEWAYIVDGHCQVTVVDPEGVRSSTSLRVISGISRTGMVTRSRRSARRPRNPRF